MRTHRVTQALVGQAGGGEDAIGVQQGERPPDLLPLRLPALAGLWFGPGETAISLAPPDSSGDTAAGSVSIFCSSAANTS
jgi:hypothetical protein